MVGVDVDAVATEQQPDDGLNFDKPFREMTPDELADAWRQIQAKLRELQRPARERKLRRGVVKPKNRAEWEIFAADVLKDSAGTITDAG